jgi:ABC-type Zn uptake system ZnuABC Zn-binding protein ZnuA
MSRRAAILLLCLGILALGGLAGCGGGGDEDGGNGAETAPPPEATELSSRNQFVVARAREAIAETTETGKMTQETREGIRNIVRLCRRDPHATYGMRAMLEVVVEAADQLAEAAPAQAERLRDEWVTSCGTQ